MPSTTPPERLISRHGAVAAWLATTDEGVHGNRQLCGLRLASKPIKL
jgi:hypothetical protein